MAPWVRYQDCLDSHCSDGATDTIQAQKQHSSQAGKLGHLLRHGPHHPTALDSTHAASHTPSQTPEPRQQTGQPRQLALAHLLPAWGGQRRLHCWAELGHAWQAGRLPSGQACQ